MGLNKIELDLFLPISLKLLLSFRFKTIETIKPLAQATVHE